MFWKLWVCLLTACQVFFVWEWTWNAALQHTRIDPDFVKWKNDNRSDYQIPWNEYREKKCRQGWKERYKPLFHIVQISTSPLQDHNIVLAQQCVPTISDSQLLQTITLSKIFVYISKGFPNNTVTSIQKGLLWRFFRLTAREVEYTAQARRSRDELKSDPSQCSRTGPPMVLNSDWIGTLSGQLIRIDPNCFNWARMVQIASKRSNLRDRIALKHWSLGAWILRGLVVELLTTAFRFDKLGGSFPVLIPTHSFELLLLNRAPSHRKRSPSHSLIDERRLTNVSFARSHISSLTRHGDVL